LECLLKEPKSKNYQDGKNKEDDRRNPIASGRSVCVHGTIPLKTFVTLLTAIAHSLGHPDDKARDTMPLQKAMAITEKLRQ